MRGWLLCNDVIMAHVVAALIRHCAPWPETGTKSTSREGFFCTQPAVRRAAALCTFPKPRKQCSVQTASHKKRHTVGRKVKHALLPTQPHLLSLAGAFVLLEQPTAASLGWPARPLSQFKCLGVLRRRGKVLCSPYEPPTQSSPLRRPSTVFIFFRALVFCCRELSAAVHLHFKYALR